MGETAEEYFDAANSRSGAIMSYAFTIRGVSLIPGAQEWFASDVGIPGFCLLGGERADFFQCLYAYASQILVEFARGTHFFAFLRESGHMLSVLQERYRRPYEGAPFGEDVFSCLVDRLEGAVRYMLVHDIGSHYKTIDLTDCNKALDWQKFT